MRVSPLLTTLVWLTAGLLVIDGDTVRLDEERIRLLGLDAAEIHHAQCEAERRLGELAKRRLEQLVQSGPVKIRRADPPDRTDKYGRTLAQVIVNGEDVACILIKEGYARPWRGHRENWCKGLDLDLAAETELPCPATY